MRTIHLVKFHDNEPPSEGWCDEEVTLGDNAFLTPALVTCVPCLAAASEYYEQVAKRLVDLRFAKAHGVKLP